MQIGAAIPISYQWQFFWFTDMNHTIISTVCFECIFEMARSGTSTQSFWTLVQRCWTINKTFNLSGFFSTVFWWKKDPLVKKSDLLVTKSRDSSWTSSFWINLGNRFLVNSYVHCWVGSYFRISFLVLEINNKMLKKITTINVYLKKTCFNITVLQSVTFVGEVYQIWIYDNGTQQKLRKSLKRKKK